MAAAISGPKASPKVCARSWVEIGDSTAAKNPYALKKVNIKRAIPMPNTVIPETVIFSRKFLNIVFPLYVVSMTIQY